jgi:hypothetical protein
MDIRMRAQLEVGSLFPKEFHDGERLMVCENLGNLVFPLNESDKTERLLNKFYDTWGRGILTLLSSVEPYKAHLKALQERYTNWNPADNNSTLAKDALFEGVGMLWTIEEGHKLWQLERKKARDAKQIEPDQPDISKAWEILEEDQKPTFQRRRAKLYLESDAEADVADCERLFKGLITYAAQVGLMLAWASLHAKAAPAMNPNNLAIALAKAINATLCTGPTSSRTRRRILLKKSELATFYPLNSLPKLEPAFATQYRYFWLELALAKEGRIYLEDVGVDLLKADELLYDTCRVYLRLLVEDRMRLLRLRDPEIRKLSQSEQKEKAAPLARAEILEDQAQARKFWFGTPIDEAREAIDQLLQNGSFPVQNGTDAADLDEEKDSDQSDEIEDEDDEGI